jgi:hypothetical protein
MLGIATADRNARAEFAEPLRNCETDPGPSASDDGDLSFEQCG